jgi:hypothetical protein
MLSNELVNSLISAFAVLVKKIQKQKNNTFFNTKSTPKRK